MKSSLLMSLFNIGVAYTKFPNRPNKCQQSNNTWMDNPAEMDNKKVWQNKVAGSLVSSCRHLSCHASFRRRFFTLHGTGRKAKKTHTNIHLYYLTRLLIAFFNPLVQIITLARPRKQDRRSIINYNRQQFHKAL